MKVTLDTNCIIDLEEARPNARPLRELIALHAQGVVALQIAGISASERQPAGDYSPTIATFLEKIERVGLAGAEILKPPLYWDVTYWDWGIFSDASIVALEERIHEILFPDSEFSYGDYCRTRCLVPDAQPVDRQWRNRKCDVLAMWSHIHYGGDIFTTSDGNFLAHRKRQALEVLGAKRIATPTEALGAAGLRRKQGNVA